MYIAETEEKTRLQNELIKVTKKHETEMFKMKDSLNTKGIELKQLKGHLEDIKKDKNALSVALKGKSQEIKELNKAHVKEKEATERKLNNLNNYKARKMNEEREEKIKKRKEIKKEKQNKKQFEVSGKVRTEDILETKDTKEAAMSTTEVVTKTLNHK